MNHGAMIVLLCATGACGSRPHAKTAPPAVETNQATVEYPAMLRAANVEGTVTLRVQIDSLGHIPAHEFRVTQSTHDLFKNAVQSALSRWQFPASQRDGIARSESLSVRVEFRLRRSGDGITFIPATTTIHSDSLPRVLLVQVTAVYPPPEAPRVRPPQKLVADSEWIERSAPVSAAARVLGWPRFGTTAVRFAGGDREVRIGDWYSMFGPSQPTPVLRVIARTGQAPTGQLLLLWEDRPGRTFRATRCTVWVDSSRACVYVADTAIDWTSVAHKLDSLGAWATIPTACENGTSVMDAGELFMERRSGDVFDIYRCNAPTSRQGESARIARAVYEFFQSLAVSAFPTRYPPPP